MKQRIMAFMAGRYGGDNLSRFMLGVAWVLIILSWFTGEDVGPLLSSLAMVVLGLCIFRSLSRNTYKRSAENYKYMLLRGKAVGWFKAKKSRFAQRKDFRFYKCPNCSVTTRVPKGHGKIKIRCPKCQTELIRKT